MSGIDWRPAEEKILKRIGNEIDAADCFKNGNAFKKWVANCKGKGKYLDAQLIHIGTTAGGDTLTLKLIKKAEWYGQVNEWKKLLDNVITLWEERPEHSPHETYAIKGDKQAGVFEGEYPGLLDPRTGLQLPSPREGLFSLEFALNKESTNRSSAAGVRDRSGTGSV